MLAWFGMVAGSRREAKGNSSTETLRRFAHVYEMYRGFSVLDEGAGTVTSSPGIARVVPAVENEAAR